MNDLDPALVATLLGAVKAHAWPVVAALALGLIIRLLKADVARTPTVPAEWRFWLAFGLGALSGACEAIVAGTPPDEALARGVVSALLAIGGHVVVVEKLRGGREIGAPPVDTYLPGDPPRRA